ncbi:MAG: helix-hairpin-helix domain-containing protein [Bacteroidetes bacterium]|nr:helix-hairpin-helix domain-containing protein [Bacteroidota bacterium]
MSRFKSWIRSFFGFSRTETNAFLILLPLMLVLIFSEPIYQYWFVHQPHDYSAEKKQLDSLMTTWKWERDSVVKESGTSARKLFSFDPNQSTTKEFMDLGFDKSLASRIVNYRTKGGKFLVKRDLMKIYEIDSSFYQKLRPFINLPDSISKRKSIQKVGVKERTFVAKFDLNKADSSQLIKIYGIGTKLSQRIIVYREKLGGYISDSQLKEVYGLDSTVVNELISKSFIGKDFQPRQINVNVATEKELGAHPYIKYKLAKAIVAYRMQHGLFASVDELNKITLIDGRTFSKMRPYIALQ